MRLTEAVRHPMAAGRKAYRRARAWLLERGVADARFWASFDAALGSSAERRLVWEAEAASLERELSDRWRRAEGLQARTGLLDAPSRKALYLAARAIGARKVVETGVANGASSFFLLSAVQANGGGVVWSLEPEGTGPFVPKGFEAGWLVPDSLRRAWRFVREESRGGLERVWAEAGAPDVFFHDSEHSYELMRWEYEAAWPRLRPGGLLASDDVGFNEAFEEFSAERGLDSFVWRNRLGLARKP